MVYVKPKRDAGTTLPPYREARSRTFKCLKPEARGRHLREARRSAYSFQGSQALSGQMTVSFGKKREAREALRSVNNHVPLRIRLPQLP